MLRYVLLGYMLRYFMLCVVMSQHVCHHIILCFVNNLWHMISFLLLLFVYLLTPLVVILQHGTKHKFKIKD